MYALGLDPNTRETGWCTISGDVYRSGVITHFKRAHEEGLQAWEIMAINIFEFMYMRYCDFVVIEDVYQGDNPQTTLKLAKLVGAIGAYCRFECIPCYYLSTATIDRSLGILGNRKLGTKHLGEMIIGRGKTQHEYDAWAALHAGMGVHKENSWKEAG